MNIKSFVNEQQYETIKSRIQGKQTFCYEQSAKGSGNKITLRLNGRTINQETADLIWHGNNYLVSINVEYQGKIGFGGSGYAIDTFERFKTWDSFKNWIDKHIERFDFYEADGQMCLF